jgi:hypothetical protein
MQSPIYMNRGLETWEICQESVNVLGVKGRERNGEK